MNCPTVQIGAVECPLKQYVWDDNVLDWVPQEASGGGVGSEVQVTNFPASQAVSGTFWQATQPVSAASLPLPAGAATDNMLLFIKLKTDNIPALGQATSANSTPVVIASNQSAVPVSGAFWQATQPVSLASVPTHGVTGPLTNSELRASPVPVSGVFGSATPFTVVSAKTAAPTANSVQADTGALPAGEYEFLVALAIADTAAVGKGLVIEHRNAANTVNINVLGGASPNGGSMQVHIPRAMLATNERVRVIAGTAAGAASSMYVTSIARRLL